VIESRDTSIVRVPIDPALVEEEIRRFDAARETSRGELIALRDRVARSLGESYAQVFDVQLLILDDKALVGETRARIRDEKVNAEWALRTVVARFLKVFSEMEDPYLKERGGDIEDLHLRLHNHLAQRGDADALAHLTEDTIVVAHSMSPSEAAALQHPHVVG